ncbi:hypothetical protein [Thioalkalivibrio sp. ALJ16]|uniref:hypothetical protein n=1 Tax=Thioalkalivibrio sp. ALJ16 TaxID=1158762 RepID=UPI0003A49B02|nr:hypothetical protein [Thioalkalivibrio sp. ALJ16]
MLAIVLVAVCLWPVADLAASERQNPWASATPETQRPAPERPRGRFPERDYDPSQRAESGAVHDRSQPVPAYPYGGPGTPSFHPPGGMPWGDPYGYPGGPGYPGMGGPIPVLPWGMGGFPFP